MNSTFNLILKILAVITLVASCLWAYFQFGWEPIIAIFVSLGALVGLFIEGKRRSKGNITQTQRSGNNSKNYQAGGDINIK